MMKDLNFLIDSFENKSEETIFETSLNEEVRENVEREQTQTFFGMLSASPLMHALFEGIKNLSLKGGDVLLCGEAGTGKELVARAIHGLSKYSHGPFEMINCAASSSDILESELFGDTQTSLFEASLNMKTRLERGFKGTLFLKEITRMSSVLQGKLLEILEARTFKGMPLDLNIILGSSYDVLVLKNYLREDLYFYLKERALQIPSLKKRKQDILPLIHFFLNKKEAKLDFSKEALESLKQYSWPKNIRELEHLVLNLLVLKSHGIIEKDDLPEKFSKTSLSAVKFNLTLPLEGIDLKALLSDLESSLISQALERTDGNKNQASKLLKLNRTTLIEKMKKNEEKNSTLS